MRNILLILIVTLPSLCFSQVDWNKAKVTYGTENELLPMLEIQLKNITTKQKFLRV